MTSSRKLVDDLVNERITRLQQRIPVQSGRAQAMARDSRSSSPSPRAKPRAQSRPLSRSRSRAPSASPSRSGSTQSPPPPRAPQSIRRSPKQGGTQKRKSRGYSMQDKSGKKSDISLVLCVYHSSSERWTTAPLRFNPNRINDRQLWTEIRETFRSDLQKPWRRIFGFKKVTGIVPIGYTPNGVPTKTDPKDPKAARDAKSFRHAFHHPERIRPDHQWVDWFVEFDASETRQNGLEFVEGLWAEKLAVIAIICSLAIIVISIVWFALVSMSRVNASFQS